MTNKKVAINERLEGQEGGDEDSNECGGQYSIGRDGTRGTARGAGSSRNWTSGVRGAKVAW